MKYFARITHGLERVTGIELSRLRDVTIQTVTHRRLDFTFPGKPHLLLGLRSVDDVYVYAGRLDSVKHTRDALDQLESFVASLNFDDALFTCNQLRFIPSDPSYAITPSLRGRHNFSRFEVGDALAAGLLRNPSAGDWQRVEADEDALSGDIDLRVIIEDGFCLMGLRLGEVPLHRRPYIQATLPGALKAPVAYSLCLLSQPRSSDVMLDALGGVGTTMIEAQKGFNMRHALIGDFQEASVRAAQSNSEAAGATVRAIVSDATAMPISAESVDRFVSDLPWGRQVQIDEAVGDFYQNVLVEIERVLKPNGRAVLLTEKTAAFMEALDILPHFQLRLARQISLYGSHPTIFMIEKDGDSTTSWGNNAAWSAFVEDALDAGLAHPDEAVRVAIERIRA